MAWKETWTSVREMMACWKESRNSDDDAALASSVTAARASFLEEFQKTLGQLSAIE
jgi:hypothetical protein